jgi:hypothetical protein
MVLFDEQVESRNTGTRFGGTNLLYHKQVMSGHPKRAGTCTVLFATAHAHLRNANAVEKRKKGRKTEHTLLYTVTQEGEMTKNTLQTRRKGGG